MKNKNKKILFYIVMAVFCFFIACLSNDYDYDLFARLIVGERFIEHGILPFQDFLSYTPTHLWYDHEWGSGVIFYLLQKHFGAIGFVGFFALIMFLISVFVVKIQRLQKHSYPPSLIFMALFVAIFMKINPHLVRCQLFSFLFFSIFLYILEGTRQGKFKNAIWFLPVITIFWNNVHGGIVSGLGLIAIYLFGAFLEKRPWRKYLCVLMLSTVMLVINPYGYKYLSFLFSAVTKNRKYVVEWWTLFAKRHIHYYILPGLYAASLFGASLLKFINLKKVDITKLIVLTVTMYMGFAHVKLLSLFLIASVSLCYNDVVYYSKRLKNIFAKTEKCLYAAIIIISFSIPLFSPSAARVTANIFPIYEIEFLKINNIKGNIVVPFGLGSYTSYKLYPNNLIYMDGRYEEVYNDNELMVLRDYELLEGDWKKIWHDYPTEILMPYVGTIVYRELIKDPEWALIFRGLQCGIFVKKESRKQSYISPEYDLDYYKKTMFNHGDFKND